AQNSKAEVIALANAGGDMFNSIKAAHEFGLVDQGVKIVPLSLDLPLISNAGGLENVQGMMVTVPSLPRISPAAAAFAQRMDWAKGNEQDMWAGLYSAVHHYLEAAKATGTDDPKAIFAWMQKT